MAQRKTIVTAVDIEHAIRRVYMEFLKQSRSLFINREQYSGVHYRVLMGTVIGTKPETIDALHVAATQWATAHADKRQKRAAKIEEILHEQCEMVAAAILMHADINSGRKPRTVLCQLPTVGTSSDTRKPHSAYMPRYLLDARK